MKKYLYSMVSTFLVGFLVPASTIAMLAIPVGVFWKRFRVSLLVIGLSHAILLATVVLINGALSIPLQPQKCIGRQSKEYLVDKTSLGFKLYEYSKSTSSQVPALPADEQVCNDDGASVYRHYYMGRLVAYIVLIVPIHTAVFVAVHAVGRITRRHNLV